MNKLTRMMTGGVLAASLWAIAATRTADAAVAFQPEKKDTKKQADPKQDANTKDIIILRSGSKLEGKILEETDKTLKFRLVSAGGLSAERTYDKSEILDIQRNVAVDGTPAVEKAPVVEEKGKKDKDVKVIGDGSSKIYLLNLNG